MLTLTAQQVVGALKSTGSTDLDVLHAKRGSMLTVWKVVRVVGLLLMVTGALASLTIIGAIIGLPEMLLGFWLWQKGDRNVATIVAAFTDYTASLAASNGATTSATTDATTSVPAITRAIASAAPATGAPASTIRSELLP